MLWIFLVRATLAGELTTSLLAQHHQQRDLQASPLRYSGYATGLTLRAAQAPASGWRLEESLTAGLGTLRAAGAPRSVSTEQTDVLTGETSTSGFTLPVGAALGGVSVGAWHGLGGRPAALGGRLDGDVCYTSSGVALGTWAWSSLDLSPSLRLRPLPSAALSVELSTSLAAVVTRFPDNLNPLQPDQGQIGGFFSSGTRLAGPRSRQLLALTATHSLPLSDQRALRADARVDWLRDTLPDPLYRWRLQLSLGMSWGRESPS